MLQAGDTDFQGLILIFFNGVWEFHTQPSDWQLSLLQPIYKEHNKDKTDPASYRGMYLNDTLAKLFEGLLIARLTTHTALFTPHTTQSKSSEDYPKGVVLARPYSVYLSLILFTNSEPNFPSAVILPWTPTAKPTHSSTRNYHAHLDWRPTLCWWPSSHVNMSARSAVYASCLPTLEYLKLHAY